MVAPMAELGPTPTLADIRAKSALPRKRMFHNRSLRESPSSFGWENHHEDV
jgi:hypothetical protein